MIRVVELFAGVGGFRIGLEGASDAFQTIWNNQWEPSTKHQDASLVYQARFGTDGHCNKDINTIPTNEIPDHDLLVGGFPCQDYSVARSLSNEQGIEGKKGVLWWQIRDILKAKKTPFVLLENVDRLVKAPSKQRGRDFGIMLRCLAELGYTVEWRIINAAEYGLPQRRRRIYIFAYKNNTNFAKQIKKYKAKDILQTKGIFAKQFQINDINVEVKSVNIMEYNDLVDLSNEFKFPFENSGVMVNGIVYTVKIEPKYIEPVTLSQIVVNDADEHYFLNENEKKKFEYLRGHKILERVSKDGHKYNYSEGAMSPYDDLSLPGRTMLTSEGSINRSTHIIKDPINNELRFLTPVECERLNQFPDNWTNSGMPEKRRYFMMGNALVCGIVKKLSAEISEIIDNEK